MAASVGTHRLGALVIVLAVTVLAGCSSTTSAQATVSVAPTAPVGTGLAISVGEVIPETGCGGENPSQTTVTPDDAAIGEVVAAQFVYIGSPYRGARLRIVSNDGTFARALVCAQLRKSVADTWQDVIADLQFSKVGDRWRTTTSLTLELALKPQAEWAKLQASSRAAPQIHAEVIRVETRDRPKDLFLDKSKDYVATVRWSTADHTRHIVQYTLWFALDGHTCRPVSFGQEDAPPRDVEQHVAVSLPLAADGTANLQTPNGQITVGPDPVEQAYSLDVTMLNKESLRCAGIDNPHGQQLRITAVDGTYLSVPIDTPATPPAFPSH
jgi:hypothetical protein